MDPSKIIDTFETYHEALFAGTLHHVHHHAGVLLGSHKPLLCNLRDQEGEDYIEPNVLIRRRCCSCDASSDWISRLIHLLATRRV